MNQIDIAPDVHGTIAATRAKHYEWSHILGELIDNAFDAGATRVDISRDGRSLTIEDDGEGCDDLAKMLTMGRHSKRSRPTQGRYGVGLKDAAWWVGGPTKIETRRNGKERIVLIDWDGMAGWFAPSPSVEDAGNLRGTRIRFPSIAKERRFPDGKRLDALLEELAFIYSPAIKSGRQIVFQRARDRSPLQRYELPTLIDVIDTTISVEGKTARVHVGIVPDGVDNPRPGISYTHLFRVILHSALGCGGLGSSRIAGWVSLDGGWTLARNKDDVSAYKDDLGEAVFAAIRPIVEKASSQALVMRTASLSESLTASFRGIVGGSEANAKARREKSDRHGSIRPTGTGTKHSRAAKTQIGTRFRDARPREFRIDFKPCSDPSIGEVDAAGRLIWLASNNLMINAARAAEERKVLLVAAIMLFASYEATAKEPLLASCRDDARASDVAEIAGRLLVEMHNAEQAPQLRAVV